MKRETEYEDKNNSLFQLVQGQFFQGLKDEVKVIPHYDEMKANRNSIEL